MREKQFQKLLWRDRQGSAILWAIIIVIILMMIAAVLYNVFVLRSNYLSVRNELERCASVSLNSNVLNPNLRDMIIDVETAPVQTVLEGKLRASGWTGSGGSWEKKSGARTVYRMTGMHIEISGSRLRLHATVQIPLPLGVENSLMVAYPVDIYARIRYIA